MSAIALLSRQEIVALGWTLLHFCWQGTAVAVAYAIIDRLTSRNTSKVRYAVALAAFMLMPLVVLGTFAIEMRIAAPAAATKVVAPASTDFFLTEHTPTVHEISLASGFEQQEQWIVVRAERLLPWVDAFWLVGVLLLALRSLGGWWQLELIRRRALRMVPQELERAFHRISEQVHAGRKVALRISDQVISPLAMGIWRATVILPMSTVTGMPKEELEAVIAHELGHIRRWDFVWNLMQTAVESVLFFHPAVWRLSRIVRERREVCCDEIAVECCAGPAVYARALLRLEEQRTVNLRMAMALGGCGGSLLGRVRKVLGEDMAMEDRMTSGVSVATAGAVVMALLLGPKATTAVAAPVFSAMRPVVAMVVDTTPGSTLSQITGSQVTRSKKTEAKVTEVQMAEFQTTGMDAPVIAPLSPTAPSARMPQMEVAPTATPSAPMAIPMPAPLAMPSPTPLAAMPAPVVARMFVRDMDMQDANGTTSPKGAAYLDGMRDAGYPLDLNNDLNQLVALKSLGVTPEYAKSMAAAGLGKPTVHELIALKSMGVTPEYAAQLKQSGLAPTFHDVVAVKSMDISPEYAAQMRKSFGDLSAHDLVTMKSLGVTPEYAAEMKQKGFGNLDVHQLVTMKSLGVSPEYAAEIKKSFGDLNVHELVSMKSLGVTPEYAAEMKKAGFGDLSVHELVSMKAQGMTPEYAAWLKQHFPQATPEELRRAAVFHLNDQFVADAKSHGFDDKNLDKLLKLKMSGLMDQ